MSYRNVNSTDILAAKAKHGDDFVILDLKNMRFNASQTVSFITLKMKLADGTICIPSLKFFNQKVSKIKAPEDRDYSKVRLNIRHHNDETPDDKLGEALDAVFSSYINLVKKYKSDGLISDDIDDDNNADDCVILPGVKPSTPILKKLINKETNKPELLDNPIIGLSLEYKYCRNEDEVKLPKLDFQYKKEGKPFYIREFKTIFKDMTSGKVEDARVNGKTITNANIHEFIKYGSLCSGLLKFDITSSKIGNLNMKADIVRTLYVVQASSAASDEAFNEDDLANIKIGTAAPKQENEEDDFTNFTGSADDASNIDNLSI